MLRMDNPALAKGGYALGLAPIAFMWVSGRYVRVPLFTYEKSGCIV